jgi:hypothetical protein
MMRIFAVGSESVTYAECTCDKTLAAVPPVRRTRDAPVCTTALSVCCAVRSASRVGVGVGVDGTTAAS